MVTPELAFAGSTANIDKTRTNPNDSFANGIDLENADIRYCSKQHHARFGDIYPPPPRVKALACGTSAVPPFPCRRFGSFFWSKSCLILKLAASVCLLTSPFVAQRQDRRE